MAGASIYLDHNATAPLRDEARAAMLDAMGPPLNASSIHDAGRKARYLVEHARGDIADALDARHADITFTSGATESNNMVLAGFETIITSAVEHSAILAPRPDGIRIKVDENGILSLDALDQTLATLDEAQKSKTLVSVIAANNETGTIQPLAEIGKICQAHKVALHSDMVQMAGKVPTTIAIEGLSFASFSAHKIGGPSGVGALWIKPGLTLPAMLLGGGQEQGRRPGTENALGIIGFGAAIKAAISGLSHYQEMASWRDEAEAELQALRDDVTIMGASAPRLPNTSSVALSSVTSQTALMSLDLKGFCLSSGSACSSGKVAASHVISAMGHKELAPHILRISGGWTTKRDDFQMLVKTLATL